MKRIPRSLKKYIRREKARIRKEEKGGWRAREMIIELYQRTGIFNIKFKFTT